MSLHVFEYQKNIPASNLVTLQDASTMADLHQQMTGISALTLGLTGTPVPRNTQWLDVRDVNAIMFNFVYKYGAGTGLTFYIEHSPDAIVNGRQVASPTIFPFPLSVSTFNTTTGQATLNGNVGVAANPLGTLVTIPTPAGDANFSLAIDRLNTDYLRLYLITAAGSPTASDKLTVTARCKRFVG